MDPSLFRFIWKNNRRDHFVILAITFASLPFYLLSLELPKRIINEAIVGNAFDDGKLTANFWPDLLHLPKFLGGGVMLDLPDWRLTRAPYLYALAVMFLMLALINVAFRYAIDSRKGRLGERLVRRLRFKLFSRYLRFSPEAMRALRGSDAETVIVDEVAFISGFMIDGSPTAVLLRMLTALFFMLSQNVWLGLMAVAVVASQGVIVPWLWREQARLLAERNVSQRGLGRYVRGVVDHVGAVQGHETGGYEQAAVGSRLARLFQIRLDLYRRRLGMTMINLALVEATPFFFYAFGGYLALPERIGGVGAIDIGQLVAIIAAYRDLPAPVRELVDWDQRRLEVQQRYEFICAQVSPDRLLPEAEAAAPETGESALDIQNLRIGDGWGGDLVAGVSVRLALPAHIALIGGHADGQHALARLLGRQLSRYSGRLLINGAEGGRGQRIAYMGGERTLFEGSVRDTILYGLKQRADLTGADEDGGRRAGTPEDDWVDYAAAGVSGPAAIDARIAEVLRLTGAEEYVHRSGLSSRIDPARAPDLARKIVAARAAVHQALAREGAARLVEPFDPARYNSQSTVGENLLFGVPLGERFEADSLAGNGFALQCIEAEGLMPDLLAMGFKIAAVMAEIFGGLPAGHMLFDRFSFIAAGDLPAFAAMLARGGAGMDEGERGRILALALAYCEPRHRLGLLGPAIEARLVGARGRFMRDLPGALRGSVAFFNPGEFCSGAPIRDNLLFGRIVQDRAAAPATVNATIRSVLSGAGLEAAVFSAGLDTPVVEGGRLLSPAQRAALELARCLIKRPDILVLDDALADFSGAETGPLLARIRAAQTGRSLIYAGAEQDAVSGFDHVLAFHQGRLMDTPRTGAGLGASGSLSSAV